MSEQQAKFHEGNSMYAIYVPKKTQEDLLEEAEYKDYETNCELN